MDNLKVSEDPVIATESETEGTYATTVSDKDSKELSVSDSSGSHTLEISENKTAVTDFGELAVINNYSSNIDTKAYHYPDFGQAYIYWTKDLMQRYSDIDQAALEFSKCDLLAVAGVGNGDTLAENYSTEGLTENSRKIIAKAKQINPRLRVCGYVQSESERIMNDGTHVYLAEGGKWEGSTAQAAKAPRIYTRQDFIDWIDWIKLHEGLDGIFFDDWGYDWDKTHISWQMGYNPDDFSDTNAAINKKWIDLIEMCHDRGLFVVTNGGFQYTRGDWYTHLNEDDVVSWESCLVSSAGPGNWSKGYSNLYDYYTNWYKTGKCKAKQWSQDYTPKECSKELLEKIRTYECGMALATGAHYYSCGVNMIGDPPFFVEPITRGRTRNITRVSTGLFQIKAGENVLEVNNDTKSSGVITDDNIGKWMHLAFNGKKFVNAYEEAGIVDYRVDSKLSDMSNTIAGLNADTRQRAPSFWRFSINDTTPELNYTMYQNLITTSTGQEALHWYAASNKEVSAKLVKNDDDAIDLVFTYTGYPNNMSYGNTYIFYTAPADLGLENKNLEWGCTDIVFDFPNVPDLNFKNGTQYSGNGSKWPNPGVSMLFNCNGNDLYNPMGGPTATNKNGIAIRFTQDTTSALKIYQWLRSSTSDAVLTGTITYKNVYLIDLAEHADEIEKRWYTNLMPITPTLNSGMSTTITPSEREGWPVYDVSLINTDSWGGWRHTFKGDEIVKMRGHTYEIGAKTVSLLSDGTTGEAGKSGAGGRNFKSGILPRDDTPSNLTNYLYNGKKTKSELWKDEDCYCFRITIPDDCTALCFGFESAGIPANETMKLTGMYMYDVNEEGLSIRGETSTTASCRLAIIDEDVEKIHPTAIPNCLYLTEQGGAYFVALDKKKYDISGAIYKGAKDAGYTGTAEEFGAALYKLMKS